MYGKGNSQRPVFRTSGFIYPTERFGSPLGPYSAVRGTANQGLIFNKLRNKTMTEHILSSIICREFETVVGKFHFRENCPARLYLAEHNQKDAWTK